MHLSIENTSAQIEILSKQKNFKKNFEIFSCFFNNGFANLKKKSVTT